MGYIDPSLELQGTTINFSCPTGQILTGPKTSTCIRNREWERESNNKCTGESSSMPIYEHTPNICNHVISLTSPPKRYGKERRDMLKR